MIDRSMMVESLYTCAYGGTWTVWLGTAINLSELEPTYTCVWRHVYAKNENRTKERVYASEQMGRRVCAHGDA